MCTAIHLPGQPHLFGRTLDLENNCGASIVITPRTFDLALPSPPQAPAATALLGVARLENGQPLYFDAINEHGLGMAALHFPGNAVYLPPRADRHNVPSYALIPWVLHHCQTLTQARELLQKTNVTAAAFCDALPPSPLHWMLAAADGALVIEPTSDGLQLYENPSGVLTNNPPFPYHTAHLDDVRHLTPDSFADAYSKGLGAVGLPGDFSSASRFVRAAFVKRNLLAGDTPTEQITQFFHLMDAISVPRGCVRDTQGTPFFTQYTTCADTQNGVYYFKTHQNNRIRAVRLSDFDPNATTPFCVTMDGEQDFTFLTDTSKKANENH